MPVVAAVLGLAAFIWWAICARRGPIIVGCGMLVAIAYVFGHEFWHAKIGPLPLTIDRVCLAALLAAFAVQWINGRIDLGKLGRSDWLVICLLLLLGASAALGIQPEFSDGVTSKWGRLIASFVLPGVLYFIARHARIVPGCWSWTLAGFSVLGTYLAITAFLEITGSWSFVFPRYIGDPDAGIHFGRARGPDVNAASLGLYLTACLWCSWTLLWRVERRWQQVVLAAILPIMVLGVLFTYTRSTWLGLAASGFVVAALEIPRRWRLPALTTATLLGASIAVASWGHIVRLPREGTAAEAGHSVSQRKSFAYVSWRMFCDHPVFGVGFGRFYDGKLPYLSDRSQDFELESLRDLHHHNTLLSLLTETGLVGLSLYFFLLIAWTSCAMQLIQQAPSPGWLRAQGVLMLALLVNYLCSALFHDLTLVASQHVLLFMFAGMSVNLREQLANARRAVDGLPGSLRATCVLQPEQSAVNGLVAGFD
jgi:O-antigen ligase